MLLLVACAGIGSQGMESSSTAGSPPANSGPGNVNAGGSSAGSSAGAPSGATGPGIFDCPTVPAPAYGAAASDSLELSTTFKTICSNCHGAYGEGAPNYPALPGGLDQASFVAKVRSGGKGMPAFAAADPSDADLAADYAALSSRPPTERGGSALAAESTWSDSQVADAYAKGLAVWRTPDPKGAACANCHSPDALDLSVIAYKDDAIIRRATLHLSPQQALVIRDFVHAQRRRFGIKAPCSTDWRPFQPGGTPLEGDTREAQDLSYLKSLEASKLLLLTDKIDTLEKAKAARDQLLAMDLRKTPLGIHFARWTEDSFNGEEHRSVNDWVPSLPRVANPESRAAWLKLQDDYLANPTTEAMYALVDGVDRLTNDNGYSVWFDANAKYGGQWMSGVMQGKYESVLLAQHFFRMAVLGKPSFGELPMVPFADHKAGYFNPWWGTGNGTIGAPCANDEACLDHYAEQFPPEVIAETGTGRVALEAFTGDFSHNWFTIGELLDQGLLNTGGFGHNTTEAVYWNALKIGEHRALKLIFNSQRVVLQTMAVTPLGASGWGPVFTGDGTVPATAPILHGGWFKVALPGIPDMSDPRTPYLVRLEGNTIRMFLILMQDTLRGGDGVSAKDELLTDIDQHMTSEVDSLIAQKDALASAFPALATDLAFYTDELEPLVTDVIGRVTAATEVASAGPGGY